LLQIRLSMCLVCILAHLFDAFLTLSCCIVQRTL
jgi:hypothetical protein